ncbi:MAG: hypothetical protein ABI882_07575, partial [Acidobacteriota bacterium]
MPYFKALVLTLFLFAVTVAVMGPARAQARRPVVFSAPTQTVKLRIRSADAGEIIRPARATFTLTSANVDDTLTGTLTLTFLDEARKKAKGPDQTDSTQISTARVPAPATLTPMTEVGVLASFRKDSGCPVIRLEIGPLKLSPGGVELSIQTFRLVIHEAPDEMSQLL